MSAISNIRPGIQTSIGNNLLIDQNTENKTYEIALKIIKAIAVVTVAAAAVFFGGSIIDSLSKVSPALPAIAIVSTFLAANFFAKSSPQDTVFTKPINNEDIWPKETREEKLPVETKKTDLESKRKSVSQAWHGGDNTGYALVGSRKA